MTAIVLAALLAAAPAAGPAPAAPADLDLRCFRLMAGLAREQDPEVRGLGLAAAQYFLGRIDAATPGFNLDAAPSHAPIDEAERPLLLRRCGDALGAAGFDLGTLGQSLADDRPSI